MNLLIKTFSCCLLSTPVFAQNIDTPSTINGMLNAYNSNSYDVLTTSPGKFGQGCSSILKGDLIYDVHSKLSSRYRVEQFYEWACSNNFENASDMKSAAVKLGIPIENLPSPFSLEGVFNSGAFKQSMSEWCSTAWSSLSDQVNYEAFSRKVNQGMVEAYKTCIDGEKQVLLTKHGVFAYASPQDDYLRKYLVHLEFRPIDFSNKPTIKSIEGSDIKCTVNGVALKTPYLVDSSTIVMTCEKAVDDSRILAFNTSATGASIPVKLPGINEGIIIDMDHRIRGLTQRIINMNNNLNERIGGISINISREPDHVPAHDIGQGSQPGYCPQANGFAFGFVNSPQNWALDRWKCATVSLTIPKAK